MVARRRSRPSRQALAQVGSSGDQVVGIGLDCTACTVLACDQDGTPLRDALLWMDQRAAQEADELSATGDPALKYVSGRLSPEWMIPKALWLKRHEPDVYDRADHIVECTDWMMHRLTGEWTLSLNHVAVKWNYARPEGGWPRQMLAAVGLDDLPDEVARPDRPPGRWRRTPHRPGRRRTWPRRLVPRSRRVASTLTWACSAWAPPAMAISP